MTKLNFCMFELVNLIFFYIDCCGCRSESKFKTQDHRPSDHFGWLEILRLNYEYFSFSPICTRGEEKFYVCINSLISAQMIIALSIFPLFSKKFLVIIQRKVELSGSQHFVNCTTKDANMSEQFQDVKLWPPERKRIANEFLMKRNIGNQTN